MAGRAKKSTMIRKRMSFSFLESIQQLFWNRFEVFQQVRSSFDGISILPDVGLSKHDRRAFDRDPDVHVRVTGLASDKAASLDRFHQCLKFFNGHEVIFLL